MELEEFVGSLQSAPSGWNGDKAVSLPVYLYCSLYLSWPGGRAFSRRKKTLRRCSVHCGFQWRREVCFGRASAEPSRRRKNQGATQPGDGDHL